MTPQPPDADHERADPAATLHATCIARRGRCALLRGASGSGKSDLALRFLEAYPDAWLVADDQVILEAHHGHLHARPPQALSGLLEVRGLGLVRRAVPAHAGLWPVVLIGQLVAGGAMPRIAEPRFEALRGVRVPVVPVAAFEASAAAKLALALETIGNGTFPGENGLLV